MKKHTSNEKFVKYDRTWFDVWIFLKDGSHGSIAGSIDSNTISVNLYIGGPGEEDKKISWKKISVPIKDIDRIMTAREVTKQLMMG